MSTPLTPAPDLHDLLGCLRDGTLTAEQGAMLDRLIASDEHARTHYVLYTLIRADLRERHGTQRDAADTASRARPAVLRLPRFASAIAAGLLIAALAVAIVVALMNRQSPVDNRRSLPLIATVTDTDGGTFIANDAVVDPGAEFRSGPVSLDRGSTDFRLDSGVEVRLVGATRMTVRDTMHASIESGVVTIDCPAGAKGYTLDLPGGVRVVDLGTRFTVIADDPAESAVVVESGRVEVHVPTAGAADRVVALTPGSIARLTHAAPAGPVSLAVLPIAYATADAAIVPRDRLTLWLDAGSGVEADERGLVQRWASLVSPADDRPLDAGQPDPPVRPRLVADAIDGQPAIRFGEGGDSFLRLPGTAELGLNDGGYEVFIVARGAPGQTQFLLAGCRARFEVHINSSTGHGARFIPNGDIHDAPDLFADAGDLGQFDGVPTIFNPRVERGVGHLAVNGGESPDTVEHAGATSDCELRLGLRADGVGPLRGDIAEVLVYDAPLTPAQRHRINIYLASKYAIQLDSRDPP